MRVDEIEQSETRTDNAKEVPEMKAGRSFPFGWLFLALLAFGGLGYAIYLGIHSRVEASSALQRETLDNAVPTVSVVNPKITAPAEEVVLPGSIQAYTDTPIYARASGYLKRWYVDIGAHVKTGDLLAELEAPEIDQQLLQARADLATAQANNNLAQSTAERWKFLLKTDSVSKQETDEKIGDLNAKKTIVDSAASNVRRLEQLQSFEKIYAPFDGVITARNTDVGALIDSGSNSPGKELFHVAALNKLRVFVNVPQTYSRAAAPGVVADLTLAEFPGRVFRGTLARTSNSIDASSRTLLTEVDVSNPTGELLPGAYVSVHLKLPSKVKAVTLPVNTLLFRSEGQRIAVVRNGKAQLVPITMGRDFGNEIEIVSGVKPNEQVIVNPADSLTSGDPVHVSSGTVKGDD
jgi:RND family efflux transporter MFP subunit